MTIKACECDRDGAEFPILVVMVVMQTVQFGLAIKITKFCIDLFCWTVNNPVTNRPLGWLTGLAWLREEFLSGRCLGNGEAFIEYEHTSLTIHRIHCYTSPYIAIHRYMYKPYF